MKNLENEEQDKVKLILLYILDYIYIRNCYNLIAADFCRQKELDADPKAIQ